MDFVALKKNPLWKDLWEEESLVSKIDSIKNQLLNTSEVDAHTLGKLRGQLDAFLWLRTLVEQMADRQMKEAAGVVEGEAKSASSLMNLRKWKVR